MKTLIYWSGIGRVKPGWAERVRLRLSSELSTQVTITSDSETIEVPSIDFTITISASGESQGLIDVGKDDLCKFIVLIAVARESEALQMTNDDIEQLISISRFKKDMPHLAFQNASFEEFLELAAKVDLIKSGPCDLGVGAVPYF